MMVTIGRRRPISCVGQVSTRRRRGHVASWRNRRTSSNESIRSAFTPRQYNSAGSGPAQTVGAFSAYEQGSLGGGVLGLLRATAGSIGSAVTASTQQVVAPILLKTRRNNCSALHQRLSRQVAVLQHHESASSSEASRTGSEPPSRPCRSGIRVRAG